MEAKTASKEGVSENATGASKSLMQLYQSKTDQYFDRASWDLIGLVTPGNHKILEIGCGTGKTGYTLKQLGKAEEVVGVDLNLSSVTAAADRLDNVMCADIEEVSLPYPAGYFDYILCGDVLEHLHDPWSTTKKLSHYLKTSQFLIASIPNVRNWQVVRSLVFQGRWDYAESGLLDFTHLRFFTKCGIVEMFDHAGFAIDELGKGQFSRKEKLANFLTLGFGKEFLVKQYIVRAKKRPS